MAIEVGARIVRAHVTRVRQPRRISNVVQKYHFSATSFRIQPDKKQQPLGTPYLRRRLRGIHISLFFIALVDFNHFYRSLLAIMHNTNGSIGLGD
jgi:hypothetical protein